jgi:hypothetical protein
MREVVERAGIVGLAKPEGGLFTDGGIFAGAGYMDELGRCFVAVVVVRFAWMNCGCCARTVAAEKTAIAARVRAI